MPYVSSNGIKIYYEEFGSGKPLVLIAGMGYGLWMWHRMIPGLAQNFRVVAFDNRGAGNTDKPDGPYSAEMLGKDTAGLMDALGLAGAAVMGHSMGGFVAQELAVTRPDLVGKLILSGTNFGGPNHVPLTPEGLKAILDRSGDPLDVLKRGVTLAAAPGFTERQPAVFDEIIAYRLTMPVPPAQWQAQTAVGLGLVTLDASYEPKLSQLKMPTLILFGAHDRVVPPANAELFRQRIANSVVKLIPDAGHIFPLETPVEANEIVTGFMTSA